jgi:hypothetical protein
MVQIVGRKEWIQGVASQARRLHLWSEYAACEAARRAQKVLAIYDQFFKGALQ